MGEPIQRDLRPEHVLLERKPCRRRPGRGTGQHVVLCEVEGYEPFVTWIEIRDDRGIFFWSGHYFTNLNDARADYDARD